MFKYLLVLLLILQTDFSFGQIVMIQTQSDAKIGIDRKAWNGLGNTASNSDGYAHDFTLPARPNACQKITGIKVEISLLSYSNNNVCPHFTTYYNLFYGCTTYAGGATCLPATNLIAEPNYAPNTSPPPFNFGSPLNSPRNSSIIPDFGDNFSIDIIPVGTPGCNPVIKGYLSYQYTIKVTVTVTDITPVKPTKVNCWDNYVLNPITCIWNNTGSQPIKPPKVNCWDNYVFNTTTCLWNNIGTQPAQPTKVNCWDNYVFNTTTCLWNNIGSQPIKPTKVNCWDNYVFNTTTCLWDNTGSQPIKPPKVNCWDNFVFNTTTCVWDNTGSQTVKPIKVNCWDNYVFNTITCLWDNTGSQPIKPTKVNCWDNYVFNTTTCVWENTGSQAIKPTKVNCWDNYVFNTTTCVWDNTGSQTVKPPKVNCWDNYVFNTTTCLWENTGNQSIQPTKANCWDNYVFNTTTCLWDNTGSQAIKPTKVNCWDNYVFNTTTCIWDNIGTQPDQPTTRCYEISIFNTGTCSWDVSGNQPTRPAIVNCWDNWVFNTTACIWDNTGVQPGNITVENLELCEDSKLTLEAQTKIANPRYSWSTGAITKDITINSAGTFTVGITAGVCSFETRIFNVKLLEKPRIEKVISDGNDIIVTTSNKGDFIYSLDENIYQSSNVFSNVVSGLYSISVTQPNCKSSISLEHWHLYLPKFFTPNNDGFNDLWEITEMKNFPNSSASIYDRYGKLIINLNSSNYSWDGTFNNNPLSADDYWYSLKLDSSKPEVKGHFSLKR